MYVRLYVDLSLCIYVYVCKLIRVWWFVRFRSETCGHGRGFSVLGFRSTRTPWILFKRQLVCSGLHPIIERGRNLVQ